MSARIQSVQVAIGDPVLAIAPQTYIRTTNPIFSPGVPGIDSDTAAGPDTSAVADLSGFRGAIVTVYHTPTTTTNAAALSIRIKHGATATFSEHDYVSSDLLWAFLMPGTGLGGVFEMLTFIVDASRVERYLSVEGLISNGLGSFQAATITPIGPINARTTNLDTNTNLFVTASGDQTYPDLDPT